MGQQAEADAKLRGAQADPNAGAISANAASIRQAMQASSGQAQAQQGQNRLSHLIDRERISGGDKIAQTLAEHRRRGMIEQSGRDLEDRKGEFRIDFSSKQQEREAKRVMEAAVLNLDTSKAAATVAQQEASRRQQATLAGRDDTRADAQARRDAERDRYQREHGLGPYRPPAPRRGADGGRPTSGPGSATPAVVRQAREQIARARKEAEKIRHLGRAAVADLLVRGGAIDVPTTDGGTKRERLPRLPEAYVAAGLDMVFVGHVSPATARRLHGEGYGLRVRDLGLPTRSAGRPNPVWVQRRRNPAAR